MVPVVVHEWKLTLRRFDILLTYLRTYIVEWFDQNPLGQVGVVLIRDRLAETLVPMGGELRLYTLFSAGAQADALGNPQDILAALSDKRKLEPSGEASLQNGLLMAKGGMA